MKKNQVLLLAILFFLLSACKKENLITIDTPSPLPPPETFKVSDWFSVELGIGNSAPSSQIQSRYWLLTETPFDAGTHKTLAYTRIPGREGYVYHALPFQYNTQDGRLDFSFLLDKSSFTVTIRNLDQNYITTNSWHIQNFRYRYIIIPNSRYQSTNANWSDLQSVSAALNFSL